MSFYDDWLDAIKNSDDDIDYLEAFLKKKDYTLRILHSGNNEQVEVFCRILLNYDFKKIIDLIDDNYISELNCSKVIQFSNLENGTYNLVRVLYGHNEGLSYPEIGRALVGSEETNAATKYGENHSKLGRDFELVTITDSKPSIVKNTVFGECFAFLERDQQIKLLKVLGLRDPVIKNLIANSKKGIVYYMDECNCLSESTRIRRRSNVKKLFELIFEGNTDSFINNIMW
ncbi:hypothetical protein [Absiella sp. AM29-15]|uniref:hypothetical protein n=1 Tax=Absiella sp. AM29-15 TaxID=2292278 RepID=UPI000E40C028|nr:hypothetical protein [Absiella sp. AM29-15]RGC49165.1 hypothetical protein DW761_13675 [Absiella sp. AM29-15]